VSTAGRKKGIFGRVRAKTGQQHYRVSTSGQVVGENHHGVLCRVSAGPNDVMSLPASNSVARFPRRGRREPMPLEAVYHDFVIEVSKRNKLKD
jgi:hypothetical protein